MASRALKQILRREVERHLPTRVGRRVGKHKAIEIGTFRTPFGKKIGGIRMFGKF